MMEKMYNMHKSAQKYDWLYQFSGEIRTKLQTVKITAFL